MDVIDSATLAQYLNTPLSIGEKTIPNRMVLAPMAGLGHIAFRELVDQFGGFGLLFTGMCSARAVPQENPKISPVFSWRPEELKHTACQIFGATPEEMAKAAKRIEAEGFFGVDLNFGCSVAAICKRGAGAALLKTPDTAVRVVEAVRNAVSCPVMVKYRTGWSNDAEFPVALGKRFQEAGADALTFHPRVAPDRRSRPPRWDIIGELVQAVDIPVFGNGNLFEVADGIKMIQTTGCQGLSLGRMAVARPWIFAQWTKGLAPEENIYEDTAQTLLTLLENHYDPRYAVKLFKKLLPYFCANFKFSHAILKEMMKADTLGEMRDNVTRLLNPVPATMARPNLNLFV